MGDFGIGDVLSAGIQYLGTTKTNKANKQIAREQMAFQERMSNTAHQREVADLKAAGMNPALTATGGTGSTTPTGSTATIENPYTDALNAILLKNQIAESKAQVKKTKAETKNIDENTRGTKNQNDANEPELKYQKYWNDLKAKHPILGGIVQASAPIISTVGQMTYGGRILRRVSEGMKAVKQYAKTNKKG